MFDKNVSATSSPLCQSAHLKTFSWPGGERSPSCSRFGSAFAGRPRGSRAGVGTGQILPRNLDLIRGGCTLSWQHSHCPILWDVPGGEDTAWDNVTHLGTGGQGRFNPTGASGLVGVATAPPTPSTGTWGSAAHLGSKPRAGMRGTARTWILCPFTKIFLLFPPIPARSPLPRGFVHAVRGMPPPSQLQSRAEGAPKRDAASPCSQEHLCFRRGALAAGTPPGHFRAGHPTLCTRW